MIYASCDLTIRVMFAFMSKCVQRKSFEPVTSALPLELASMMDAMQADANNNNNNNSSHSNGHNNTTSNSGGHKVLTPVHTSTAAAAAVVHATTQSPVRSPSVNSHRNSTLNVSSNHDSHTPGSSRRRSRAGTPQPSVAAAGGREDLYARVVLKSAYMQPESRADPHTGPETQPSVSS